MSNDLSIFGNKEELPAHIAGETDGAMGNEDVGGDIALPKIALLQAMSPQLENVEGAKAGMLHNSVSDELYDNLFLVNLYYTRGYSVFKKRNLGGGFEGNFDTRDDAAAKVAELGNEADYDISVTAKHFCLILDPTTGEPTQPCVIYMSATKLRVSDSWNSEIQLRGRDNARFSSVWKMGSTKVTNAKGTFYNFDIDFVGWTPPEAYSQAKETYLSIKGISAEKAA